MSWSRSRPTRSRRSAQRQRVPPRPELRRPGPRPVDDDARARLGVLVAAEPSERETYGRSPADTRDPCRTRRWVRGQGGDALKFLVAGPRRPAGRARRARPGRRGPRGGPPGGRRLPGGRRAVGHREPDLPAARRGARPGAAGRRDHRGGRSRWTSSAGPAQAGVPGQPRGLPAARRRDLTRRGRCCRPASPSTSSPHVLRISCDEGGASGFIAGRAVWKEAVGMEPRGASRFLGRRGPAAPRRLRRRDHGRARP